LGLIGPLEGMILDGSLGTPLLTQMNQGRVSIKHEAIIYTYITIYNCIPIISVYIHIMNV
jgi:hypothetical protein